MGKMIARVMSAGKRVLGMSPVGRNIVVFPDDIFLVSFPKSGNTWMRFLLANLVCPGEPANFSNIDQRVPESETLTRRQLQRMARPRIMKSHQYFDPRFMRVIYIVRDPRDVAVSQYHFFRKRGRIGDDHGIERFVTAFVEGATSDYGSWQQNVASWVVTRYTSAGFLLLRYEDMTANPERELGRVAEFIGITASQVRIAQAVNRSSAEEMRKLERAQPSSNSLTRNTRQDIPFVRAARSGGWKTALPEESVIKIEAAWGPLMEWLGYELSTRNSVIPEEERCSQLVHEGASK